MNQTISLDKYFNVLDSIDPVKLNGKVTKVIGLVVESDGPAVGIGELCFIYPKNRKTPLRAEVVGFKDNKVLLMPLGEMIQIEPNSEVVASGECLGVNVSSELLGRVLDGLGNPLDGKPPVISNEHYCVTKKPPHPLTRQRIKKPLPTGVRAIDGISGNWLYYINGNAPGIGSDAYPLNNGDLVKWQKS